MPLAGLHIDPEDGGASDGAIGIDHTWEMKLGKALSKLCPKIWDTRQVEIYHTP
jgi:hypothetical protein